MDAGASVSSSEAFLPRLQAAVEWAVLWGVKIAIVLAIVLMSVSYLVGDYNVVRERALNGQRAFEFIQAQQKAPQEHK